jgi:hypothetical protein
MSRIHSTLIALVLGTAATVGLYAGVHTVRLGQKALAPSVSARDLAAWGHSLHATLAKHPPALPKLPHYAPVRAQQAPPPSVAIAQPHGTYVHAPTVVQYKQTAAPPTTTTTGSWSDDGSGDGSDGGDSGGGD